MGERLFNMKDIDKWDKYFLRQTKHISSISPDKSTKCGSIITKNNKVIAQGFNGNAKRLKDSDVPESRPDKYFFRIHSEINAILNTTQEIDGSCILYVSGLPCASCLQMSYHVGLRKIIYTNYSLPKICDEENQRLSNWFLSLCLDPIELIFVDRAGLEE